MIATASAVTILSVTIVAIGLFLGHGAREILSRRGNLKRGGSGL